MDSTLPNLESILSTYSGKPYEINIKRSGSTKVEIRIYKRIFGIKFFHKLFNFYFDSFYDHREIENIRNPLYKDDTNLDFSKFIEWCANSYKWSPDDNHDITQAVMGMVGEIAEIVEQDLEAYPMLLHASRLQDHIKKIVYHQKDPDRNKLRLEHGDVLFYFVISMIKHEFTLTEIIESVKIKLTTRYPDGRRDRHDFNKRDQSNELKKSEVIKKIG